MNKTRHPNNPGGLWLANEHTGATHRKGVLAGGNVVRTWWFGNGSGVEGPAAIDWSLGR
jgi:hypothetical protein